MTLDRHGSFDDEKLHAGGGRIKPFEAPLYDDTTGTTISWEDFPEDDQDKAGKPQEDPRGRLYKYIDNRTPPPGYEDPSRSPERGDDPRDDIMTKTAERVGGAMGGILESLDSTKSPIGDLNESVHGAVHDTLEAS